MLLAVWDVLFLNRPALMLVVSGFFNTIILATIVIVLTLIMAWITAIALHTLNQNNHKILYLCCIFLLNLFRSIPQILGVLLGYVVISLAIDNSLITAKPAIFVLLAFFISTAIFLELVDLMRERIDHFRHTDFYNAMRVCGIAEFNIVNFNILWKNSRLHIFNKLISTFGTAIFLICSVDFVVSVGLSSDVNSTVMPTTLGNLLARIDSKQDILAVGYTLTHPLYAGNLFFTHLQGITVAFLIVYTLLCLFMIANAYSQRHRL